MNHSPGAGLIDSLNCSPAHNHYQCAMVFPPHIINNRLYVPNKNTTEPTKQILCVEVYLYIGLNCKPRQLDGFSLMVLSSFSILSPVQLTYLLGGKEQILCSNFLPTITVSASLCTGG